MSEEEAQGPEPNTLRIENPYIADGFTQIPNWILRTPELSRDAKLLYGLLLSYAWQDRCCFPGYETLMESMQCRKEALVKYIKELRETGLVEVQRRGQGKTSIYTIKDRPQKDQPQKFGNRTSRSSEIEPPEVRKPNHDEYSVEEYEEGEDGTYLRKAPSRAKSSAPGAPPDGPSQKLSALSTQSTLSTAASSAPPDEARQTILSYLEDIAREFGDASPLKSSVTRAVNLYRAAGLSLEEFTGRLLEARAITKESVAKIKSDGKGKKKMAYFFGCLEQKLGLEKPPAGDGEPGRVARKKSDASSPPKG